MVPTYCCEQHVVQEQGHEHNEQDETAWTAAPGQQIRPRIVGEQVEQHGEEEEKEEEEEEERRVGQPWPIVLELLRKSPRLETDVWTRAVPSETRESLSNEVPAKQATFNDPNSS